MARKPSQYDDSIINETGKYNNSQLYSMMVMELLNECCKLRQLCYHGTSSVVEEFVLTPEDKTKVRLDSIERYITTMLNLMTTTIGQSNKINNIDALKIIELKLKINYTYLPSLKKFNSHQNHGGSYEWIEINQERFILVLNEVNNLYVEATKILTQENMIHYNIPEFDEDKAKEIFTKNFVEEG